MMKKITVVDFDPHWKVQFEELRTALADHLVNEEYTIEHVGSTSVPGLKAKPIIDVDIVIDENDLLMKKIIYKLSEIGYNHVGNLGVTGREAFKKTDAKTPYTGTGKIWFEHNLYLCQEGSIGLQNHINFRDYLKSHPLQVKIYGNLKQELAIKYPYDIDSYIDGKTDFIVRILNETGMKKEDQEKIDIENRLKDKL